MLSNQSGVGGARRTVGWLLVSILAAAGGVLSPAAQSNRVAEGEAAAVGQPVPGPSARSHPTVLESSRPVTPQDAMQARQQLELRKLRFEKMKEDVRQLSEMAKSLQDDIEKSNPSILPVGVTEEARKIQKLAGKIRSEVRY